MNLKVFVPDWDDMPKNYHCSPLLYPFLPTQLSPEAVIAKYGTWVQHVMLVTTLKECDVAILKYEIGYYYASRKTAILKSLNAATSNAGKLLICTVKGDAGITPPLRQFHLYRFGGYASKNKGNQFVMPAFISDPLPLHSNGKLFIHEQKTEKPIIGFCGQGKGSLLKWGADAAREVYYRAAKALRIRFDDHERLQSSTYTRAQLLDALERSPLVTTLFIRHKKYRNGAVSKEAKAASSAIFFRNLLDTQYTLCYRGAGNFSVRLYETMACGRIPVIVMSDNQLPFPHIINWNAFPVIQAAEKHNIAQQVAAFHHALTTQQFIYLQQYARHMWEQHLSYNGFMHTFVKQYLQVQQQSRS